MTTQPAYTRVSFDAAADPAAVVIAGPVRFTVLGSRLIRMEYAPNGVFEDRPSQVFWFRRRAVPNFEVEREGDRLILTTDHLRLVYRGGDSPFAPDTLQITLLPDGPTWRYGDADRGNLLGTTRTLDMVNGNTLLEPGLLSRDGWTVVDDSRTLVFDESDWLTARAADETGRDLYFFGYGRHYREALRDYLALAGGVPLLPRWALGNWWSRYWAYDHGELLELMAEFRRHDVPLSVCIVDMDWHLVDVGEGINGWTGYTWNPELFPDPQGFIARLHDLGLRTALNLHPALGVRPYEVMYGAMAERLGVDPKTQRPIPFDIADRQFADAYFEVLHHPQEAIGVDFWWMDWQQGTQSAVAGLDPLWWLNHLHFHDLGRDGKRPFIFSRWGGLGNHRYPIGFSGDTVVSWDSLAFQPYFTATAANVAYGWWSHDIGGHMQGIEDRELYARWVQFGVFSPIFRLHSTKNPFHDRRPWGYDAEVLRVTREAMQLRHALIPYLYTMSRLNAIDGTAPVRPMYHDYPDREEAYACPQQYLFGTDLIVAPYASPADNDTRLTRQAVWLPPGDWYHLFTGEYYAGDGWHARYGELDDVPVYIRAGAILPLGPRVGWGGVENPDEIHLHVFAGANGRFSLYEDDGVSTRYREDAYARTIYEQRWEESRLRLTIAPPSGDRSVVPAQRTYRVFVYGINAPARATMLSDGATRDLTSRYDPAREVVELEPFHLGASESAGITLLAPDEERLIARRDRTRERVESMLRVFRMDSLAKLWLVSAMERWIVAPEYLADFGIELAPAQMRALLETTQGVGAHYVGNQADPHLLVLWNNRETPGFRHHFAQLRTDKWFAHERYGSSWGSTPRFRALRPEGERWRLAVDYFGLHVETFGKSG